MLLCMMYDDHRLWNRSSGGHGQVVIKLIDRGKTLCPAPAGLALFSHTELRSGARK